MILSIRSVKSLHTIPTLDPDRDELVDKEVDDDQEVAMDEDDEGHHSREILESHLLK